MKLKEYKTACVAETGVDEGKGNAHLLKSNANSGT
jgi:hypothetical protein